jgi:CBS domain-containing protein
MTPMPITVPPEMGVLAARDLMAKEKIRHLLVTEGETLVGIVTDRDIRLNLPSQATSLSVWELNHLLQRLTVGEVMTRAVITVEPEGEAVDAARIILDHKIGALPVVEGRRIVGILTETDFVLGFVQMATPRAVRF